MSIPQALVVGAGIAGLAAAGAIRDLGWDVSMIEQRADFNGIGTGLFVPANGIRALAALGIPDSMACRGQRIHVLRVRSADGSAGSLARLEKVWPGIGASIAIHGSLLHEALLDAALVPARMGVRLASLAADSVTVRATFDDGSTGRYDLVVGADGADSTVRGLLWPDAAAGYGGESWWRGIAPTPPGLTDWTLTLCQAGNLVTIPVGAGLTYWGAGISPPGAVPRRDTR